MTGREEMEGPVQLSRRGRLLVLRLHRPEARNAIDSAMLLAINAALDLAEADSAIRTILLEGDAEVFCTGLDLRAALGGSDGAMDASAAERGARQYLAVLRRFTRSPKIIACRVAGRCEAGGIGFVAAADFAVAECGASFRLSEALIGLLPATLMPFLIRRVGFRTAYRLTLAAPLLGPAEALAAGLVDAAGAAAPEALRGLLLGSERVPERTVAAAKAYFDALAPITAEMEECAVGRITSLLADPEAASRIRSLMAQGLWQGGRGSAS
jgi:polyketide biosynthesis enoyl-CoA hydratase PksH